MQRPTGNRMLDGIPDDEFSHISSKLEHCSLKSGEIIYHQNARIRDVFFPTGAILSVITVMQDGGSVEIGTYGREGMSGAQIILGSDDMPSQMLCQVPGDALSMPVEAFRDAIENSPVLETLVRRYTRALLNFMGQSVACNRLHETPERCARWLALTRDRVTSDEFILTQEFLAIMLGVNRPSVSIAAGALQEAGFISYRRGHVTIKDRQGLESAACECHQIMAEEFEKVFTLS